MGLYNLWKIRRVNTRMYRVWKKIRDSRVFKVPEYGSLEDAMKIAMNIQIRGVFDFDSGEFIKLYTRQNPLVIQITGDQTLPNYLDGILEIYGDYVHIIGIRKQNKIKPILTGTFGFGGSGGSSAHRLTIENLDMEGGLGCKFRNATVTMVNVNVQNSSQQGVRVENGDIALKHCIFSGNGYCGLYVQGSVLASDCHFEQNARDGVKLESLTNSEFRECTFKNNNKYGLRVQGNVYLSQCTVDNLHADARKLETTIFKYKSTVKRQILRNNATVHGGTVQKYTVTKTKSQFDPYIVLNVNRTADANTIREAYLRKVKETHPDKLGTNVDFRKTQWAYEILRDKEKKIRYDKGIVLDVDKFVQLRF